MLTPLREHYLKKELISRQLRKEIEALAFQGSLDNLGPPFTSNAVTETDLPFLRFVFRSFVQKFPLLKKNGDDFWREVGQFVDEFNKKNISSSVTRNEETKRKRLAKKIVSHLTLLLNAGTKTTLGRDESIRVEDLFVRDEPNGMQESDVFINNWSLNVAAVRSRVEKTHLREHVRIEYIIITKRPNSAEVVVPRRHKEFRILYGKLKEEILGIDVPRPPRKIKDKTPSNKSHFDEALFFKWERNRNSLRAYMRQLLAIKEVARSYALNDFLTKDSIRLTNEEIYDMRDRRRLDNLREEQQKHFVEETETRAKELKLRVEAFKKELLTHGLLCASEMAMKQVVSSGLMKFADMIKATSEVSQLPDVYQKIIEYGEIHLASVLYNLFLGSDNSAEVFAQLKHAHGLMPYKTVRGILKISNPLALIRGLLDLFLARPFGRKSLMQRLLAASLSESIKEMQKDIDTQELKIADPEICVKLKNFVCSSMETQQRVRAEAAGQDTESLICSILRTNALEPKLGFEQLSRFGVGSGNQMRLRSKSEHASRQMTILYRLLLLYVRRRDKEMLIDLLFEGVTSYLLRDLLAIFYEPLARVYRAANVGNSLSDMEAFIDDLIEVVEDADKQGMVMSSSPQTVVQTFVRLVQRHTQRFYNFVHAVYLHDSAGIFTSLLEWMEKIAEFIRNGLPTRVDISSLVVKELDADERCRLLEELDSLISWHTYCKQRHLEKLRNIINGDSTVDDASLLSDDLIDDEIMSDISGGLAVSDSENEDSDKTNNRSFFELSRGVLRKDKRPLPELDVLPKLLEPFVNAVGTAMIQTID